MKRIFLAACAASAVVLSGCETTFVSHEHRPPPPPPPQQVVVVREYVYYPQQEVYYSTTTREYVYVERGGWVRRPSPPSGITVTILSNSPSVPCDFHDEPSRHHTTVVRQYPRHWGAPPPPPPPPPPSPRPAPVRYEYVYYPSHEAYYCTNTREYIYPERGSWVRRTAPPSGISVEIFFRSPSVKMDFHDDPAPHHSTVARKYPRHWGAPPPPQPAPRPSPTPSPRPQPNPHPPRAETPAPRPSPRPQPTPNPPRAETPRPQPPRTETPAPQPPRAETPRPQPPRAEVPAPKPPPRAETPKKPTSELRNYVYYPKYETYYCTDTGEYLYMHGTMWKTALQPMQVSAAVLKQSPSVRMDFHDNPVNHHTTVMKNYPRDWSPSGRKSTR